MGSGSANRQRIRQCLVRFTEEEFARIAEKADKAGLAVAAFLRGTGLGKPGPRAMRRPPADHQALRRLLGHLGRVGNNLNQIAHRLNAGGQPNLPELRQALAAYLEIRNAIFNALGMRARRKGAASKSPPAGP